MDVAVLLAFGYHFGGDGATAHSAPQQAAKSRRLFFGFLNPAAQLQNILDFIKEPFFDYRRVSSFVHLAAVAEVPIIERVGEQIFHLVFVQRLVAAPRFGRLGSHSVLIKETADVFQPRAVFRVQFKRPPDSRGFALVHDDCLGARVVEIAERSDGRIVSVAGFLPQAPRGVRTQVAAVLRRHAELHGHQKHVVRRIVASFARGNTLNDRLLEQPTHISIVKRIARQAVQFPTENTLRLAALYALHHIVKHRTPRLFCRAALGELLGDMQTFPFCQSPKLDKLSFDREDLLVLDIGGFAGVEKVVSHRI